MKFRLPFMKEEPEIKKTTRAEETESGVSGDIVFDDFNDVLMREDKHSIKDYRAMRDSDATVQSLFSVVSLPILSANFGIKAAEDDENEEQADFIRKCLFKQPYLGGMDIPFSLVLEQMLHAIIDGFEVFERVYKIDSDGNVVVKKLALRDAKTVKIRVDDHGGYEGIKQKAIVGLETREITLPAERTFLFTYGKADSQYYGRSAFKSLYDNWDRKRKLEYLDGIAHQSSAVYPKLLKRVDNTVIKDSSSDTPKGILSKLAKLGKLKPTMSLPYGFDVEELKGGSHDGISESIERQNSEMARAFLATFTLLGSQGSSSVGSYALSADQSSLFMIGLKGTMNLIVDHINQYWIADLIDRNYPVGNRHYPEFYFEDLTDETATFMKSVFTKLVEKDKVSDELIAGILEKIKNKFDIESIENATEAESEPEATEETKEMKEDDGSDAGKFRRELYAGEEKVNWRSLERQIEKTAANFEKAATPILEKYALEVAKNPNQKIKLPDDYLKLVESTYRSSYNYGKLSASDEESEKAPKTKGEENANTAAYLNFIDNKQVGEIESLIASVRLKYPIQEPTKKEFGSILGEEMTNWVVQTVTGMKESIFGYGNNAGRADAFSRFDDGGAEAVYMWSALLENSCAVCQELDGRVVSESQMRSSIYQPGTLHLNCHCIWVRMTGENKPKVQGWPDNLADLNFVQNAPKALLKKEGIIEGDETKKNAVEKVQFNQVDNGKTLNEVEDSIRDKKVEYFAAFDDKGVKLADLTDGSEDSVQIGEAMDYLVKNNAKVATHNHPHGSSFSIDDLIVGAELDLDEIRAVSEPFDYFASKTADGWPAILKEKSEAELYEIYNEYITDARMQFNVLKKHDKKLAKFNEDERWQWLTNEAISTFAEDYGINYKRIERK